MLQVLNIPMENRDKIYVTVQMEESPGKMHLDSRSPVSIILAQTLQQLFPLKHHP